MGKKPLSDFKKVCNKLRKDKRMPVNGDGIPVTIRVSAPLSELRDKSNPLNWKTHTVRQDEYVGASMQNNGWARPLLFNAHTDRLIDGHGRLSICEKRKMKWVEVEVGWYTPEVEQELLALLDTSGSMAVTDGVALTSLIESALKRANAKSKNPTPSVGALTDIHAYATKIIEDRKKRVGIKKSTKSVDAILGQIKRAKPTDKRESPADENHSVWTKELLNDIIFPTDNKFGIPNLLESKLWKNKKLIPIDTFDRSNVSCCSDSYYCETSRPFDTTHITKPVGGFLGFYCEDYKFNKYYNNASYWGQNLMMEKWHAILEPDFSTYEDWPLVMRQWSLYRARWCGRYWQELGIKIIPQLHRCSDIESEREWLYDTLPSNCPIMHMQLRMGGTKLKSDKDYWANIARILDHAVTHLGLELILFYANPEWEKYIIGKLPPKLQFRFITPFIEKRKKMLARERERRARERIKPERNKEPELK